MALLTKPNMQQVWASGGDIIEPSDLKKQQGWTVEVPPHQFENWIQNRQDEYLAHINQRGIPAWDGNTEYEAGGLSYVQGSDGKVYKSVAASGPSSVVQNPTTDVTDTYWTVAFVAAAEKLNAPIATVAAAGTINLTTGAPNTSQLAISGTGVSINGFTVAANRLFVVKMTGASNTLVNSASLVTGRGANIPVVAGDSFLMRSTAANTVEIVCGDFLIDRGVGSGQTWQDVTAARALGVAYTNTTGRTISVSVNMILPTGTEPGVGGEGLIVINGTSVVAQGTTVQTTILGGPRSYLWMSTIVPSGATYQVNSVSRVELQRWMELR